MYRYDHRVAVRCQAVRCQVLSSTLLGFFIVINTDSCDHNYLQSKGDSSTKKLVAVAKENDHALNYVS